MVRVLCLWEATSTESHKVSNNSQKEQLEADSLNSDMAAKAFRAPEDSLQNLLGWTVFPISFSKLSFGADSTRSRSLNAGPKCAQAEQRTLVDDGIEIFSSISTLAAFVGTVEKDSVDEMRFIALTLAVKVLSVTVGSLQQLWHCSAVYLLAFSRVTAEAWCKC